MKRTLFIIPFLSSGGAEKVASIWANELAELDADIYLLVFYRVTNEYSVNKKVKIHSIKESKEEYDQLSKIKKIKELRKKLKEIKPYVVIPFISYVGIMTTIVKVGLKIKVIETIRNNPKTIPANKISRLMRNTSVMLASKCIMQNKNQLEYFPSFIQKKSEVFFNPISSEYFNKEKKINPNGLKNIVAVGRLVDQKDYFTMVDSIKILVRKNRPVNLSIYGDGPLCDELNKYIRIKNLENNIKICGRTSNVREVLSDNDIYVLSSKWEGMPNSLMEAMAMGLPCISTDCPTGPSDLIENRLNGRLVPVGDSIALADAIIDIMEKVDDSIIMGDKARKSILKRYSSKESAKNLLQFLGTV